MKLIDFILLGLIAAAVVVALRYMRRKGPGGCCGDCASCGRSCGRKGCGK